MNPGIFGISEAGRSMQDERKLYCARKKKLRGHQSQSKTV
jgi:hypothetical protein